MRSVKKIAIVGGGPSALFAIMACADCGIIPDVFYRELRLQPGAFWFHWVPDWIDSVVSSSSIRIGSVGTRRDYIEKQWKNPPESYTSSFPENQKLEEGYDPKEVSKLIFESHLFNRIPLEENLTDKDLFGLKKRRYDLVFHSFPTSDARNAYKDLFVRFPTITTVHPGNGVFSNSVIYNGFRDSEIVRSSFLWGVYHVELVSDSTRFREWTPAPVYTVELIPFEGSVDPLQLSDSIVPIGRMARFERPLLSHETYKLVRDYIER